MKLVTIKKIDLAILVFKNTISYKFLLLLFYILLSLNFFSQEITLENNGTFSANTGFIYDNGGKYENINNELTVSTLNASNGYIKIYFTYFELPTGSTLKIFNGLDTSELIGVYDGVNKPANLLGKTFTFVYYPSTIVENKRGWEGVIEPYFLNSNEKATLPESDCIGAIPLCSNSTVNTSANQYENTGNVNDDSGSCYSGTGSGGSVWYKFSPTTDGPLDFLLSPLGTTDYDFVLWDITNGCGSKTQVSCNFSATTGATGLSTSGAATNSQDASGTNKNQRENVVTTRVYAICINYYSGTNGGFNLNFQNNAGSVAVTDNVPPTITNVYTTNCASASTFTVTFSEFIDCSTIQASDFTIAGYTVNLVSTNCTSNRTLSVVISVSPALSPGTYTINGNTMTDLCGNVLNSPFIINTTAVPTANAGPDLNSCTTPGFFGSTNYSSVTLTGSGGTSYLWSTGQAGASISVTPTATTTYTLTAIQGSCSSTDQVTVSVGASPTPNLGANQTLCSGFPVTLTGSGGGTYQWQSTTSTDFFGNPTGWANIAGQTGSTMTITPASSIFYRVVVTGVTGCIGRDDIRITLGAGAFGITAPPFLCYGSSATLTLPASMTAYTWTAGGVAAGSANAPLTISPTVTTTYVATSTTAGCTGTASVTIPVRAQMSLSALANPTTACPGIPVSLSASGPTNVTNTVTDNFEGTNGFTLVNGTFNRWYAGSAAFASGASGLYIGTASTNNNYEIGSLFSDRSATSHAYKDYTVTSYCTANLNFKWKCGGNSSAALTVWVIPTNVTPTAGTALVASATQILLGTYFGTSASYSSVSLNLAPYAGQNIRVVFSWRNTGGAFAPAMVQTAAAIDDVVFTETTSYNYAWSSNPSGFSASTSNATSTPTEATTFSLTVTRCDGCPVSSSVAVGTCTVLGMQLNKFDGFKALKYNQLKWSTLSEENNHYFTLERSSDGVDWRSIAIQDGQGNSSELKEYSYNDYEFIQGGVNYYRLKQTDFNGNNSLVGNYVIIDNSTERILVKRINILGQEVSENQKGLVIHIYSNGEMEKVFVN
ncbi:MAG: hypothetical protein ACK5B9_14460 [Flavobacteriia bacterium]|jgi:hypothetical protein